MNNGSLELSILHFIRAVSLNHFDILELSLLERSVSQAHCPYSHNLGLNIAKPIPLTNLFGSNSLEALSFNLEMDVKENRKGRNALDKKKINRECKQQKKKKKKKEKQSGKGQTYSVGKRLIQITASTRQVDEGTK